MKILNVGLLLLCFFSSFAYADKQNQDTNTSSSSNTSTDDAKKQEENNQQSDKKPSIIDFCKEHTC